MLVNISCEDLKRFPVNIFDGRTLSLEYRYLCRYLHTFTQAHTHTRFTLTDYTFDIEN